MTSSPTPLAGQRGPADHERREQIIREAGEHFRHYGYNKTTVADLAKAIGVSGAYVYRFFESKQAIGEAVCAMTLATIDAELMRIATDDMRTASDRLRGIYRCLADKGLELFFKERKLHDLVLAAVEARWSSVMQHKVAMMEAIRRVIGDGRASGEFERKTPIDEISIAVYETLEPFAHPMLLELKEPAELEASVVAVSNLVLRSLAP
ncbi:MAG TPA: TetR/AcrR family transcriptional regulator [Rhodanobacteraceae bacterium]|nr:TetR/AcrR family transcriptional regulator [Rhodanobacteraceae bacterium]